MESCGSAESASASSAGKRTPAATSTSFAESAPCGSGCATWPQLSPKGYQGGQQCPPFFLLAVPAERASPDARLDITISIAVCLAWSPIVASTPPIQGPI